MELGNLRGRISDLLRVYFGGFSKIEKTIKKDFHFWEKYWIGISSVFSGMVIGFGLSGQDISPTYPIIIILWVGLFIFDTVFNENQK